jgi:hypothetical protein
MPDREFWAGPGNVIPETIADLTVLSLHKDVHASLFKINYEPRVFRDPAAIATILLTNCPDTKPANKRGVEFRAMTKKQS